MANEKLLDLIDRTALDEHIGDYYGYPAVDILHEIATFPTVDAVPVVHGRWEQIGYDKAMNLLSQVVNSCYTTTEQLSKEAKDAGYKISENGSSRRI